MSENTPIVFADSKKRLSLCMQYLEGYKIEILDGQVKKELDKFIKLENK